MTFEAYDSNDVSLHHRTYYSVGGGFVVDDRSLDVPTSVRNQIATKLERAGVGSARTAGIKAFTPVGRAERGTLYGESLPPGLLLGSGQDA